MKKVKDELNASDDYNIVQEEGEVNADASNDVEEKKQLWADRDIYQAIFILDPYTPWRSEDSPSTAHLPRFLSRAYRLLHISSFGPS